MEFLLIGAVGLVLAIIFFVYGRWVFLLCFFCLTFAHVLFCREVLVPRVKFLEAEGKGKRVQFTLIDKVMQRVTDIFCLIFVRTRCCRCQCLTM